MSNLFSESTVRRVLYFLLINTAEYSLRLFCDLKKDYFVMLFYHVYQSMH